MIPPFWMSMSQASLPKLEVLKTGPAEPQPGYPTLVFAHGAFAGAWIWLGGFLQHFAEAGFPCVAFGFRGHGNDDPIDNPPMVGLDQYILDLKEVLDEIEGPKVVIAHSMGGLVAQMALGQISIKALCLMSPAPVEGMALYNARMALSNPSLWMAAFQTAMAPQSATPAMTRQAMLSPDAPQNMVDAVFSRLRPEPTLALSQAQIPQAAMSASALGVPTLVIRGSGDQLIPDDACMRTAMYHGARYERIDDLAHGMMIDTNWIHCAGKIHEWLHEVAIVR